MEIYVRNINQAYTQGLYLLGELGVEEQSRNGRVVVLPETLITTYTHPWERVLFSPERNANPFFHLMEALWMMDGRRDAAFLKVFNSNMSKYENEEGAFDGAYGYRWRRHFGYDQLRRLVTLLKDDPTTRRAVLAMHDANYDLGRETLDQPCNTHIYFDLREGRLNMTVCCRSNDAIWGAYGANVVHMSVLQEVIAALVGAPMGVYRQFSNNFHYYPDVPGHTDLMMNPTSVDIRLAEGWSVMPLVVNSATWFTDLHSFMNEPWKPEVGQNPFFYYVARPMYMAWEERKKGKSDGSNWALQIEDQSWQHVCLQWIGAREAK